MSFQQIQVIGRLGSDPEIKYLKDGKAVANFTLAVSEVSGSGESRTEKATWFKITAWEKLAEICSQFLRKGKLVHIVGKVKAEAYLNRHGEAACAMVITAATVTFLSPRDEGGGSGSASNHPAGAPRSADSQAALDALGTTNFDEIPF